MNDPALNETAIAEIDYALGIIGHIEKAFQTEQTRLKQDGVIIRNKPVWQAIHDTIWLLKSRRAKIKRRKKI